MSGLPNGSCPSCPANEDRTRPSCGARERGPGSRQRTSPGSVEDHGLFRAVTADATMRVVPPQALFRQINPLAGHDIRQVTLRDGFRLIEIQPIGTTCILSGDIGEVPAQDGSSAGTPRTPPAGRRHAPR
jgi:hypothetical protein